MSSQDISTILTNIYTSNYPNDTTNNDNFKQLTQHIVSDFNNKLWYQLTLNLKNLFNSYPILSHDLYSQFIQHYSLLDKLNPLDIFYFLSKSLENNNNQEDNITQLNHLLTQLNDKYSTLKDKNEPKRNYFDLINSIHLTNLEIIKNKLYLNQLSQGKDFLNQFNTESVPLFILNKFYHINSIYFHLKHDYNNFYQTSLLYLSTLQNDHLTTTDVDDLPFKMCIAALKGDQIYNFGELLQHPLLSPSLNDPTISPDFKYTVDLLHCLSQGDFHTFNNLIQSATNFPQLSLNDPQTKLFLTQKICIMTLIELIFIENLRILSFEQIATRTNLTQNINDVEHLIMKAISLGLLKGSIDQVNSLVTITWVQPRIINLQQIDKMNNKLIQWNHDVHNLAKRMDQYGESIWV